MSAPTQPVERITDRLVLMMISVGLISILLSIIVGIFRSTHELPNWAENVLVSIGTAAALKLGDCLSTLVALSTGKSVERLGNKLGDSSPNTDSTGAGPDAVEAARQTADAAAKKSDQIADGATDAGA